MSNFRFQNFKILANAVQGEQVYNRQDGLDSGYFISEIERDHDGSPPLSSTFAEDAYVALFNCSQSKSIFPSLTYFNMETKKWLTSTASCLNTDLDAMSFCQRTYPKLNVINILKVTDLIKFKVKYCLRTSNEKCLIKYEYSEKSFKCLYGTYKSTDQLNIPKNCLFQHLYTKNECKSNHMWELLSKKCNSITATTNVGNFYLNSSVLLQWCDVFKSGISTFNGIEFVCCPMQTSSSSSTIKQVMTGKTIIDKEKLNEDEDIDDDHQEEVNNVNVLKSKQMDDKDIDLSLFGNLSNRDIGSQPQHTTLSYASLFFLVGFCVTISIFASGYFYLNKKRASNVNNNGNILNQHLISSKLEDTHVNNMQVNGYENPTYKFFERQHSTNA